MFCIPPNVSNYSLCAVILSQCSGEVVSIDMRRELPVNLASIGFRIVKARSKPVPRDDAPELVPAYALSKDAYE